ncbi:hypothetical protein GGH95_000053 [Coemansia sp. RSA 1836]|nr:hypothetical protein GGH95_000053 [Coemansia sp. RSA 1836]
MVNISFTSNIETEYSICLPITSLCFSTINETLTSGYGISTDMVSYCHDSTSTRGNYNGSTFKERFMTDADVWAELAEPREVSLQVYLEFSVQISVTVNGVAVAEDACERRIDDSWKTINFGVNHCNYNTYLSWEIDGQRSEPQEFALRINSRIGEAILGIDASVDLSKVKDVAIELVERI